MTDDKVSFGYAIVTAGEKRRLVDAQFDAIAKAYDLADAILSLGLKFIWKLRTVRRLCLKDNDFVLDLCGGTADLALLASRSIGRNGLVVVYDINLSMMEVGRLKAGRMSTTTRIAFAQGDAECLSFPDRSFDAVTVGFGVRNLVHLETGLREVHRVLRPGGRFVILEFSLPTFYWLGRLYDLYSFHIMPRAAKWVCGKSGPFVYLAESIRIFPPPEKLYEMLRRVGFSGVTFRRLCNGIAVIYLARKQ